jgi:fructose-bisphosphate aldolase class I
MDESNGTCNKRFAATGIPQTEEARRAYRELIVTTRGLGESVSGTIVHEETVHQRTTKGATLLEVLVAAGIIHGVKVDIGAKDLAGHAGEKVTEGLDGLRERLSAYPATGLRLAKWRAVIALADCRPSRGCIEANVHALARYAALCQEVEMVPIVEPEVMMAADHAIEVCGAATERVLRATFSQLRCQGVTLEGMILKPNAVLAGLACPRQGNVDEVAEATIACLSRNVPAAVAGVAFLSGGQSGELASARLNAMNVPAKTPNARAPWPPTFFLARAIQQPALKIWRGEARNVAQAQRALHYRATCSRAARQGGYSLRMEEAVASASR